MHPHPADLLVATERGTSTVLQGWLLLLECYSRLMYRPSTDFEGALERYCLGVLPGLGPAALSSLVGSAARLQLPLSPQLEDGIVTRLEQVRRGGCTWLQQFFEFTSVQSSKLPARQVWVGLT
jgi:hypothetical protein